MKDAQLRKKMKEFGLPTHGDRKTIEARFQRYSTIHNSECDKPNPRPIVDLIKLCDQEENLERKMDRYISANGGLVNVSYKTGLIHVIIFSSIILF